MGIAGGNKVGATIITAVDTRRRWRSDRGEGSSGGVEKVICSKEYWDLEGVSAAATREQGEHLEHRHGWGNARDSHGVGSWE